MHSPAALFMYESASGERVTLYCSKLTEARTGFRYNANEQFAAVQWIEGGYGYVVSGPVDKMRLKQIARSAYEQMENRAPPPPTEQEPTFIDRAHVARTVSLFSHILARIVGFAVAPLAHQFLEIADPDRAATPAARSRKGRRRRPCPAIPCP